MDFHKVPDAVFFDFDGTLTLTEERNAEAWRDFLTAKGIFVGELLLQGLVGRRAMEGRAYLREHVQLPVSDAELVQEFYAARDHDAREPLPPVNGAREVASALGVNGVALGIVTSARRSVVLAALEAWDMRHLFGIFVTADSVDRGKPDPLPYRLACREAGVMPGRSIAVEDSPTGITAAREAGLYTVAVTATHERAALEEANEIVASLLDLRSVQRLAAAFGEL